MKYKIGDKVKFMDEVGGGVISGFQDIDTALVRNEDDFDIPYLLKDLILVDREEREEEVSEVVLEDAEDEVIEEVEVADYEYNVPSDELQFAFVEVDNEVHLYLVNDTHNDILYNVIFEYDHSLNCIDSGRAESETKVHITSIPKSQINEIILARIQYIITNSDVYEYESPSEVDVRIRSFKALKRGQFEDNDYFDEKALLIQLNNKSLKDSVNEMNDVDITKVIKENKDQFFAGEKPNKKTTKREKNQLVEVDLHLHEVIDDERGLSNGEKLNIQISHFRNELEGAISSKVKRIVFIHGIGNGTLKHELRKILDQEYPKHKYQDASFKEYGYGATMVII